MVRPLPQSKILATPILNIVHFLYRYLNCSISYCKLSSLFPLTSNSRFLVTGQHILICNSCDWLSTRFHELQVTLLGLLGSATCQHLHQPQQTKKEPTITRSCPLLATVKSRTLMPWQYWWYITYITPLISRKDVVLVALY